MLKNSQLDLMACFNNRLIKLGENIDGPVSRCHQPDDQIICDCQSVADSADKSILKHREDSQDC